jgi:DNA-binding response OmpR family regulator
VGANILVAEDDVKQADLVRIYLEREGFTVQVVGDGATALDRVRDQGPDLVVLDVMMPAVNGLDVCRTLRAESTVPILLLTARTTEQDVVRGLGAGADDYVTKPFSPRELTARVRALLRRAVSGHVSVIEAGDVAVDTMRFEVRVGGRTVRLTAREFAILEVLAAEPGRVFTRVQIIDRAFDRDADVLERTVDAHIVKLRRKLEAEPGSPRRLETVVGRGYRLVAHRA